MCCSAQNEITTTLPVQIFTGDHNDDSRTCHTTPSHNPRNQKAPSYGSCCSAAADDENASTPPVRLAQGGKTRTCFVAPVATAHTNRPGNQHTIHSHLLLCSKRDRIHTTCPPFCMLRLPRMLHNSRPGKVYKFDFRSMGPRQLHKHRQTRCRGFEAYFEPVGLAIAGPPAKPVLTRSRCMRDGKEQGGPTNSCNRLM
jgi:hypothetical protein